MRERERKKERERERERQRERERKKEREQHHNYILRLTSSSVWTAPTWARAHSTSEKLRV